mgnify:CR=1 FL=1
MLDHVFTDVIGALRDAFESAFLERQAFEEHFRVDVLIGNGRLERAEVTVETIYSTSNELDHESFMSTDAPEAGSPAEHAVEVTYEGLYELAEESLADRASTLLAEHFGALGGWIATMLVKLGDVKYTYLPATETE